MIEGDGKKMMKVMMMIVMIMVIGGQLLQSTQSTDDGFAEYILESSDVLIKSNLLSLSQVICWSCSDFRLNAFG
jgi:hypothetical protein